MDKNDVRKIGTTSYCNGEMQDSSETSYFENIEDEKSKFTLKISNILRSQ